jgi:hypothetical protein
MKHCLGANWTRVAGTLKGEVRHTLMSWGFLHEDGWFDILWRLCGDWNHWSSNSSTGEADANLKSCKRRRSSADCASMSMLRMTPFANAFLLPNWNPFSPARFAVSRDSGVNAVGSRPCATSTREHNDRTFVTSPRCLPHVPMKRNLALESLTVNNLGLCFVVQLCLAFGLAGLLWPEKFMPLFETLMFPWAASCRGIRANGIAAIGLSILLLVTRLSGHR